MSKHHSHHGSIDNNGAEPKSVEETPSPAGDPGETANSGAETAPEAADCPALSAESWWEWCFDIFVS
jgi:hypothetical protein